MSKRTTPGDAGREVLQMLRPSFGGITINNKDFLDRVFPILTDFGYGIVNVGLGSSSFLL